MNIAIDGPAGAGKSTIAKRLAKELGFIYVDTGAMYRAMALYFLKHQMDASDEEEISRASEAVDISIRYQDGEQQVLLNGENVNGKIRSEEVGNMASSTSVYPKVPVLSADMMNCGQKGKHAIWRRFRKILKRGITAICTEKNRR